jgi:hypothetical protein
MTILIAFVLTTRIAKDEIVGELKGSPRMDLYPARIIISIKNVMITPQDILKNERK